MIYEKVYKSIIEHGLLEKGSVVIAAVSGGADSVCMLDVLINLKDRLGITVECAHLNHNLRGSESDADEQFVKALCKGLGIKLHSKSVDVLSLAKGKSIEEAAREARYGFFTELTGSIPHSVIATAHNADDNVESFFIALMRSSGSRGLCGIPRKRDGFIRPMLDIKRCEITEHLESIGQSFCTDSTNSDTRYLRNFIRHRIIPELKTRKETDVHKAVTTAMENLRSDCAALDRIANTCNTDKASELIKLDDAVLCRVLSRMCEQNCGIILDRVHFLSVKKLLALDHNSKVQIREDVFAYNDYGVISFRRTETSCDEPILIDDGCGVLGSKRVLIKKLKEINSQLTKNCFDCDKINGNLFIRTRREGDIFYPQKRSSTSKLKKLFINAKIPIADRDARIILCTAENDVVFVEGFGVDKRFAPDQNSKSICVIETSIIQRGY